GLWLGKFLESSEMLARAIAAFGNDPFFSVVIQVIIVTVFCLFCVALVSFARGVAIVRPNRTLSFLSIPILIFAYLSEPFAHGVKIAVDGAYRLLGLKAYSERELAASPEEISEIVELSTKAGQVEEDEREMIMHVFSFSETVAREVMTPRKDIVW